MHKSLVRIREQRRNTWKNKYPWLDQEAINIIVKNNQLNWHMSNFIKNRHWFEHHPSVSNFIQREDRHQEWQRFVDDIQSHAKDVHFPWTNILFG